MRKGVCVCIRGGETGKWEDTGRTGGRVAEGRQREGKQTAPCDGGWVSIPWHCSISWGLHKYDPDMPGWELIAARHQVHCPNSRRDEPECVPWFHQQRVPKLSCLFNLVQE